jgi:hypothetical protein
MLARMVARQCALALFLSSAADAASVHNWDAFKTVDAISYVADIAVDLDKPINCKLDKDALGTNLRFVANQSLRLKIIPPQERFERQQTLGAEVTTLSDELAAIGPEKLNTAEYQETQKQLNSAGTRARYYIWMPIFYITGAIHEVGGACTANLQGELQATTSPANLLWNDARILHPDATLWTKSYWVTAGSSRFSAYFIDVAEQLMKELVNDWSAAQQQQ